MSRDVAKLRKRADAGKLSKSEEKYVRAREGLPAFDRIISTLEEPEFEEEPESEYDELKVDELKAELDAREVEYRSDDTKADLVARLVLDDEAEED